MVKTNRFRLFCTTRDGGEESRVWAHWLFAWKALCSVGLLRFENGSREAYHSHAFDCVSWVLRGELREQLLGGPLRVYRASWRPVVTRRSTFHKVTSVGRTWVLTFRGPWADKWREYLPQEQRERVLTHGRIELPQG